ncbi:hypothetical protein FNF29_02777 [Cafeteria roenbergensis]|nr:hypothetical protein FNF29_02777 [Cafeteria roenbergensis]KAA0166889.1 hypothetical protein FNF31_01264 [Cafeteria roenbergensis]|eukprot:KAA0154157.1 hypothetical protein FNF29_02777 [Cafeteria roenbergensis]
MGSGFPLVVGTAFGLASAGLADAFANRQQFTSSLTAPKPGQVAEAFGLATPVGLAAASARSFDSRR